VDQKRAYLFALTAALLWSTVPSAFKLSLRYLTVVEFVLISCFVSTLVLGAILAMTSQMKDVIRCTKGQLLRSALLGFLNPFLYYIVLLKAYELLPAQVAQPLNMTWALTLAILSVPLLHQRISGADFAGLIFGLVGVLVISTQGNILSFHPTSPLGVGYALGSAIIWSIYWIYSIDDQRSPLVCLFVNFVFGCVWIGLYYLLFAEARLPNIYGIMGAVYIGLFEMSIPFAAWNMALRLSENTAKVSSLICLAPFISLILVHYLVGEDIKSSTIIGLLLIVSGLLVQKFVVKSPQKRY